MVDVARRLCEDNQIHVNEVWSYHSVGDEIRFTLVQRNRDAAPPPRASARVAAPAARKKPAAKVVAKGKKPAAPKAVELEGGGSRRPPSRPRPPRPSRAREGSAGQDVPFVRVSRDKRGYETIYLVHTSQRRGRPPATRVLYWFRTPPGIRVGREPVRCRSSQSGRGAESGVAFDWPRLSNIPAPPPDVEQWRERRRAEKAAKQARRAEELEEAADARASPSLQIDSPEDKRSPARRARNLGAREEDALTA